jgi:hypothetical protein
MATHEGTTLPTAMLHPTERAQLHAAVDRLARDVEHQIHFGLGLEGSLLWEQLRHNHPDITDLLAGGQAHTVVIGALGAVAHTLARGDVFDGACDAERAVAHVVLDEAAKALNDAGRPHNLEALGPYWFPYGIRTRTSVTGSDRPFRASWDLPTDGADSRVASTLPEQMRDAPNSPRTLSVDEDIDEATRQAVLHVTEDIVAVLSSHAEVDVAAAVLRERRQADGYVHDRQGHALLGIGYVTRALLGPADEHETDHALLVNDLERAHDIVREHLWQQAHPDSDRPAPRVLEPQPHDRRTLAQVAAATIPGPLVSCDDTFDYGTAVAAVAGLVNEDDDAWVISDETGRDPYEGSAETRALFATAVMRHDLPVGGDLAHDVAQHGPEHARYLLASLRVAQDEHVWAALAGDESPEVRDQVAANPMAPEHVRAVAAMAAR